MMMLNDQVIEVDEIKWNIDGTPYITQAWWPDGTELTEDELRDLEQFNAIEFMEMVDEDIEYRCEATILDC